ncbi:MAG: cytosolic protein [Bacteroidales bacterium]|nr:cytosolic protein [Bacteroidales bacterium]
MIIDEITRYVEENIASFHTRRIHSLDNLKLKKILERKNPYLFKAKHVLTAEQIIKGLVDAHISSNEETIFGDWLEGLAIFINGKIFGGKKSSAEGIDLEFDNNNVRYIVSIKSGPNWGNSGQINKMISNFNTARKILRTGNAQLNVIAVNGCCYGRDNHPDKNGIYFKYCGQKFWEFISGDPTLYTKIIKPLGHHAREKNESFMQSYAQMVNKFTFQFTQEFCNESGAIDWEKLIKFNSSAL